MKLLTIRDLKASVSSTLTICPLLSSAKSNLVPASSRRASPHTERLKERISVLSLVPRHAKPRRGKYPCAVIALASLLIGSDGEIPYHGLTLPERSCAHATLHCTINTRLSLATGSPRTKRQRERNRRTLS
jgi:hypothetical protein